MADGDEAVGEEPIALRLEQALELADDAAAPVADLLAELAKARTGPVGERPVVLERVAEPVAELGEWRQLARAPADLAGDRLHRASPRGQARSGVEGGDQQGQLGAVQHAAVGLAARQHGADVGDAVERRRALGAERQARLTSEGNCGFDGGDVGGRRGAQRPLAAHGCARFCRQKGSNGVPFGAAIPDSACPHPLPRPLPLRGSGSAGVRSAAGLNRTSAPGAWPSCEPPGPCACAAHWASRSAAAS